MLIFHVWHPADPFCSVDVFIRNPIAFDALWSRAQRETLGNVTCRIASIPDLIAMKRIAGRLEDLRDIEALQQIQQLREGDS